ncbi:MAG: hypothetical protein JXB42_01715 [Deltaproteobacteria bacterium]|nr:hypothetical protein [Deltaproteobacteria bacterium]
MTGLTDDVLSAIRKKQKKGRPETTDLYQSIATMKDFGMTPGQWKNLSRFDKRLLHYHRVMEGYYFGEMTERAERDAGRDRERQEFLNSLPKQRIPRRGRR